MKLWKLIKKLDLDTHIKIYKSGLKYDGLACDLPCGMLFQTPEEKVLGLSVEKYDEDVVLEITLYKKGL